MMIAIMLPSLIKIGIWVDFEINQDFIAEVLCINKDKPTMKCNGKCYLSKELKKADEHEEKQAPNSQKEKLDIRLYYAQVPFDLLNATAIYVCKLNAVDNNEFYNSSFITGIFRPPKLNLI